MTTVPAVVLPICAPEVIAICGAATVTDPALPVAVDDAKANMPVPGRLSANGPCAWTVTVPPLPLPAVP